MYLLVLNFFLIFFLSVIFFKIYKKFAESWNFTDLPDELSSHTLKIPTGSGIIISILLLFFYLFLEYFVHASQLNFYLPNRYYLLFFSVIFLGIVGFYDDIKNIHYIYRLLIHFFIVMMSLPLFSINLDSSIVAILPYKLILIIFVFFYVYIINIYNFIDGADGYLSINSIFAFIAFCLSFLFKEDLDFNFYLSFIMIPILLGYLFFNKPKARLFMGDSGSIVVGYLIAYIFFVLILEGQWDIALCIIFYPFLDVSLTILRKMKNGHNPWDRLFDYYFLRALSSINFNHHKILVISIIYNIFNLVLILLLIIFQIKFLVIISFFIALLKILFFNRIINRRVESF